MDNTLPSWLQGQDVSKLAVAAQAYWQQIEQQLNVWLSRQHSIDASEPILNLLAWERGITRLPNEPLNLYALRVQTAQINAVDAGTKVGMERIFKRLGFAYAVVTERLPWFDWDQIQVAMREGEFGGKERLIMEIIQSYGKTCRRYIVNAQSSTVKEERAGLTDYKKEVAE